MYREITGLLFHPGDFFARKQHEEIRLFVPAVILGIAGMMNFLSPLLEQLFTRGGDISRFGMIPAAALGFLLLPFALWLITAGVLYVVCMVLSGTGSFPATLQNCGYGYLPQTLVSPLMIVNGITEIQVSGRPSMLLHAVIFILGIVIFSTVFWSVALWTAAMEKTHGLSRGRALAGPLLVLLLSQLPLLLVILTDYPSPGIPL